MKIIGVRKFKRFVKGFIYPLFDFRLYPQAIYDTCTFLDLLIHMAITNDSAENGSNTFKLVTKKSPFRRYFALALGEVQQGGDRGAVRYGVRQGLPDRK